jgi:hypothetical protein
MCVTHLTVTAMANGKDGKATQGEDLIIIFCVRLICGVAPLEIALRCVALR